MRSSDQSVVFIAERTLCTRFVLAGSEMRSAALTSGGPRRQDARATDFAHGTMRHFAPLRVVLYQEIVRFLSVEVKSCANHSTRAGLTTHRTCRGHTQ